MFDACVLFNVDKDTLNKLNIEAAHTEVKENLNFKRGELVFFKPKNIDSLKKAVKHYIPAGIVDAELIYKEDNLHYIKSGIDDPIAKEMAEKKIAVVFDLKLLLNTRGIDRARIIRKMRENMRRAVKYNIPILFASFAKNKYELFNGYQIKAVSIFLGIDKFKRVEISFKNLYKN